MLQLTIQTTIDRYLARVAARLANPDDLLLPWGQSVAREARRNARNKGGRRFWREVAAATRVKHVGANRVSVANYHVAGAQKQFGGTIRPKAAKALTIPISDEARGKRAGEFETGGRRLFVLERQGGDTVGILGYSENEKFHALFVLRTRVVQQPDPWWPDARRISVLGNIEAETFARRTLV